jgi:hypothetical protein
MERCLFEARLEEQLRAGCIFCIQNGRPGADHRVMGCGDAVEEGSRWGLVVETSRRMERLLLRQGK